MALVGAVWSPHANVIDLPRVLQPPSGETWLGYDDLGRALADRVIAGAQVSLTVAVSVVTLSLFSGTLVGVLAGWYGGLVDRVLTRCMDIFLAFPGLLLAIALAGLLGPGLGNVIIALCLVGWVGFARLARAQTLTLKERAHVEAARVLGQREHLILWRHVIPLLAAPLIVEAGMAAAGAVMAEAGLAFLGLGVQPPDPSWGSMIRDGTRYMLVAPHMVIVPGVVLACVVLAINQLGDYWRDRWDVRLRKGE